MQQKLEESLTALILNPQPSEIFENTVAQVLSQREQHTSLIWSVYSSLPVSDLTRQQIQTFLVIVERSNIWYNQLDRALIDVFSLLISNHPSMYKEVTWMLMSKYTETRMRSEMDHSQLITQIGHWQLSIISNIINQGDECHTDRLDVFVNVLNQHILQMLINQLNATPTFSQLQLLYVFMYFLLRVSSERTVSILETEKLDLFCVNECVIKTLKTYAHSLNFELCQHISYKILDVFSSRPNLFTSINMIVLYYISVLFLLEGGRNCMIIREMLIGCYKHTLLAPMQEKSGIFAHSDRKTRVRLNQIRSHVLVGCCKLYLHTGSEDVLNYIIMMYRDGVTYGTAYQIYSAMLQPENYTKNAVIQIHKKNTSIHADQQDLMTSLSFLTYHAQTLLLNLRAVQDPCVDKQASQDIEIPTIPYHVYLQLNVYLPVHVPHCTGSKFILLQFTQTKKQFQYIYRLSYRYKGLKLLAETQLEMKCLKYLLKKDELLSKDKHRLYPVDLASKFEFKYHNIIHLEIKPNSIELSINNVLINLNPVKLLQEIGIKKKCRLSIGSSQLSQDVYVNGVKDILYLEVGSEKLDRRQTKKILYPYCDVNNHKELLPRVSVNCSFNKLLNFLRIEDVLLAWLMSILNPDFPNNHINLDIISSYIDLVITEYHHFAQAADNKNYSTLFLLCQMHDLNTSKHMLPQGISNTSSKCSGSAKKCIKKLIKIVTENKSPTCQLQQFKLRCLLSINIGSRSFLQDAIKNLDQMEFSAPKNANELIQFLHYFMSKLLAEVLHSAVYSPQFLDMVHNLFLKIYHTVDLSFHNNTSKSPWSPDDQSVLVYMCQGDMVTHIAYYLQLMMMASDESVCSKFSEDRVAEIIKWVQFMSSLVLALVKIASNNSSVKFLGFKDTVVSLSQKVSHLVFDLFRSQDDRQGKYTCYLKWRKVIINSPEFSAYSLSRKTSTGFTSVYHALNNLYSLTEKLQRFSQEPTKQCYLQLIGQRLLATKSSFLWGSEQQQAQDSEQSLDSALELEVFNIHSYMLLWNYYFIECPKRLAESDLRLQFMRLIELDYPIYNIELLYRIAKYLVSYQIQQIDFLCRNVNNFDAIDLQIGFFHRLAKCMLKSFNGQALRNQYSFLLDVMKACDSGLDLGLIFDFKNQTLLHEHQSVSRSRSFIQKEQFLVAHHACEKLCASINGQCPYPPVSSVKILIDFVHKTFQISEIEVTVLQQIHADLQTIQSGEVNGPGVNKPILQQKLGLCRTVAASICRKIYNLKSKQKPQNFKIELNEHKDVRQSPPQSPNSIRKFDKKRNAKAGDNISLIQKVTNIIKVQESKNYKNPLKCPESIRSKQTVVKVLEKMQQLLKKEGMKIMYEYHRLAKILDSCEQINNQLQNKPNCPTFSSFYGLYRLSAVTNKYRAKTLLKKDYTDLTNSAWMKVPRFDDPNQILSEQAETKRHTRHVDCAKELKQYYQDISSIVENTFWFQSQKIQPNVSVESQNKKVFNVLLITATAVYEGNLTYQSNCIVFNQQYVQKSAHFNKIIQILESEKRTKDQYLNHQKKVQIPVERGLVANPKKFLHQYYALEFFTPNFSYFFVFRSQQRRRDFSISSSIKCEVEVEQLEDKLKDIEFNWMSGLIRNFEFLMEINNLAGRSVNDLSQYYIFPWTVFNFHSPTIDHQFLNNPANFRNLEKSIGALDCENLKRCQERYRTAKVYGLEQFLFGTFYSNPAQLCNYLVRIKPFTQHHFDLQGSSFDYQDRLFTSIEAQKQTILVNQSNLHELIPQFYSFPQFLHNRNKCKMLNKTEKIIDPQKTLGIVRLPKWVVTESPEEFIFKMRQLLQSQIVSSKLRDWADLIFGYKSKRECAIDYCNLYHSCYYSSDCKREQSTSKQELEQSFIKFKTWKEFGQVPNCIFGKKRDHKIPHQMGLSTITLENYISAFYCTQNFNDNDQQMLKKSDKGSKNAILAMDTSLKQWIFLVRRNSITICFWLEEELEFTFNIDDCCGEMAIVTVDLADSVIMLYVNSVHKKINAALIKKEKKFIVSRICPALECKQQFLDGSYITTVRVIDNKVLVCDQNIIRIFIMQASRAQDPTQSITLFNKTVVAVELPALFTHISPLKSLQVCQNSKVSVCLDYSNYVTVFTIADRIEISSTFNVECFSISHELLPKLLVHDLGLIVFLGLSSSQRYRYKIGVYNYYGDCVCVIDLQMSQTVLDFQLWDPEFSAELLLVCSNCIYQVDIWKMYELGDPVERLQTYRQQPSQKSMGQIKHRIFKFDNYIKQSDVVSKVSMLNHANRLPQKAKSKDKKLVVCQNKSIAGVSTIREGHKWVMLVLWQIAGQQYNQVDMVKKDGDNKKFLTRIYRQNMSSNYKNM